MEMVANTSMRRAINSPYLLKNNIFLIGILILQNVSIFFLDIVNSFTILQLICLMFYVIYFAISSRHIKLPKYLICWMGYVLAVIINIVFGGDKQFIITFVLCNLLLLFQINIKLIALYEYKIVKFFTFIHLVASLLIYFARPFVEPIWSMLLGANYSSNYSWRVITGVNAGITTQPGTNAIFLTLLFLLCFIELFMTHKKPVKNFLIMGLSFLMLFTTSKRSMLLLSIVTILIIFIFLRNKRSTTIKKTNRLIITLLFGLSICLLLIVLFTSNILANLLDKIVDLNNKGDISNGRFDLWTYALSRFAENPLLGVGLKSVYNETGYDVHNTYIQVLAETGVIGFTIMFIGILHIVRHSYRNMLYVVKYKNSTHIVVVCAGFALMVLLLLYGFLGNIFIDYIPIALFGLSIIMANNSGGVTHDKHHYSNL